jgi:lysophospholipase L1-like esterase
LPDTPWHRVVVSRFRRSENPILFYEPNPGATSEIYTINSAGFRDHEYPLEKKPGVFRIVMLGDSIVWGHGLTLQDTIAKQLEALLNKASDRPFEVLNFGVSGYSTQQEVELYRVKASRYDPDLVIVGYCLNDFEESSVEGDAFRHLYYGIFSKSYFFDYLRRGTTNVSYNQFGYMSGPPQAQFDLHEQFRLLQSYCDGRRNVVVVFPILYDFDHYFFAMEHQRIHDALEGLNYATLDLLNVYRGHASESLILHPRDRTHPNPFGAQLAAQATFDLLVKAQLVPITAGATGRP